MAGVRRRVYASTLAWALGLLVAAMPAEAYDDLASAQAAYDQAQTDLQVPVGWTGSVIGCKVGTQSQASIDATLRTLNIVRRFVGIPAVTFDPELNSRALAAALMQEAKGEWGPDDDPHNPGPDWPCYTPAGADASQKSSLALGQTGATAILGWVEEDEFNLGLGHRRWLIDASAEVLGTGSTDNASALHGSEEVRPVAAETVVAWPAPGFFPEAWLYPDWSVEFGNWLADWEAGRAEVQWDVSAADVNVTLNGVDLPISMQRPLDDPEDVAAGFHSGPGTGLAWRVERPSFPDDVVSEVAVTITGVTMNGAPFPVSYTVAVFGAEGGEEPPPAPRFTKEPQIRGGGGTLDPGDKVRVVFSVENADTVDFRWLCNGKRIRGADGRKLKIRRAYRGCRLAVKVIARSDGGKVASTSDKVRVRRPLIRAQPAVAGLSL